MNNFEDDAFNPLDFATGVKKEKPKDLYNILETTIDSMGIIEPVKTAAPVNQVVQADIYTVPEMAKPIDIHKTSQAIGNLVMDAGVNELRNRQSTFDRQKRSNQTFGYRNASYNPQDNQEGFIRTSGVSTPPVSNTNAGTVSDLGVNTKLNPIADFAVDTGQGAMIGGAVSQVTRPAQPLQTLETRPQQTPMTPQATPQERIPSVSLRPMQIDRSFYIMNRLASEGFTREQAAGIVGNLVQESQLNHTAVHPGGGTFGLAQWRGSRIEDYVREFGPTSETTPEKQVEFMIWEFNNTQQSAARAIRNARTIEEASDAMRRRFERPRDHEANDAARRRYSNEAYRVHQHRSPLR